MSNLALLAAQYRLGELAGEDLPQIAIALLDEGRDSPSLRELAGLVRPTLRDAGSLFERTLAELGESVPSEENAFWFILRLTLQRIVRGEIDPGHGAYNACSLAERFPDDERLFTRWLGLITLASQYADYPEGRPLLAAEIVAAAEAWLAELNKAAA